MTSSWIHPTRLFHRVRRWVYRRRLRDAAITFIQHGWPVLPGSWFSQKHGRDVCDISGCLSAGLHPVIAEEIHLRGTAALSPDLHDAVICDRHSVLHRWQQYPYSVLLPTGITLNAVEFPERYLSSILIETPHLGPTLRDGGTIFTLFRADGSPSQKILSPYETAPALLHTHGSWIPAPPSFLHEGRVRWVIPPETQGWILPTWSQIGEDLLSSIKKYNASVDYKE